MNKWYQSAPCKGILVLLEHVFAVVMAVCLVWTLTYPAGGLSAAVLEKPQKNYSDSKGFQRQLQDIAGMIVWSVPVSEQFETDGVYDKTKIVDIKEYTENQTISGENKSGLAYTLESMIAIGGLSAGYTSAESDYNDIIVCKKPDGSFYYYYGTDFTQEVEAGNLVFGNLDKAKELYAISSNTEMVSAILEGWLGNSDSVFENIQDGEGQTVYERCWKYDGYQMIEAAKPVGAENILEIVNENPEWNGKLSEALRDITSAASNIATADMDYQNTLDSWSEGNTNIVYLLVDLDANHVFTNRAAYQSAAEWKSSLKELKKLGKYVVIAPKLADFESNMEDASAEQWRTLIKNNAWTGNYICAFAVDTDYPIQDRFYQESKIYGQYAPAVRGIFVAGVVSAAMFLFILIWLTTIAGRSNKEDGVRLMAVDKLKTEIFLAFSGGFLAVTIYGGIQVLENAFGGTYYNYTVSTLTSSTGYSIADGSSTLNAEQLFFIGAAALGICAAGLILWLGIVRRMKAKTLWQNSVLKWAGSFLKMVLMHIGIVWKIILAFGAFVLIHWIAMMVWDPGIWFFLMLLAEGAAFVYLMRGAIGKSRIKRGVEAIARGQVEYQIPLTGLRGEQLEVAKYINKIGDGLDKALEESMKNERLKTDLITNVSHDIKTPLTSIINYVELFKRENFEDPRIQNYLKVLEEKAFRLKTLTEDVVEASKVSSGNIKLEMMNLNLIELINQTSAEFDEKFEARDLQFILHTPSEPVIIYADGRRMWRVFANVFSNAAKYAMEHSRVYADLYQNDREVFFTIKNISEQPLNISPDELTERFIRGDVSRSTEGSGLGLSIARNLTELQGGSFELYLDGDLFKVMIRFPRVRTEEQDSDEGEAKAADNGPLEGNGYSYCGDIGRKDI